VRIVYEASNSLDAHVVKNLLETEGIAAFVQGDHLQGGVGELAAMGFVKVSVNDEDVARALTIIQTWERLQPADEPATLGNEDGGSGWSAFLVFVLGFAAGALSVWLYLKPLAG
jgi:hypothetical protein